MLRKTASLICLLSTILVAPAQAADTSKDQLWAALASGKAFAIMRHALAPGTGDPAGFDVNICTTQRNLSDEGRAQARRTGVRFRRNGIDAAMVYSSAWCRCTETAELLKLGPVRVLPSLNSFFQHRSQRQLQTDELKAWLQAQPVDRPLVLVTHQVNITALTGVFPSSGEIVFMHREADGSFVPLGSLPPQ